MRRYLLLAVRFNVLAVASVALSHCGSLSLTRSTQLADARMGDPYTRQILSSIKGAQDVFETGLGEFNEDTLPHQAKDFRKQIVSIRDVLDIYSHNFADDLSLWEKVRDDLDLGYTVVGNFKDLYDADAGIENPDSKPKYRDKDEVKKRRKVVLKWKTDYFKKDGQKSLNRLLKVTKPLVAGQIEQNPKFSRFFWGGVEELPSPEMSPSQNARLLAVAIGRRVLGDHQDFLKLSDLGKVENEEIFHDHRKRVRTMVKICNFALGFDPTICVSGAVETLAKASSDMGKVEDLITAGRLKKEQGKDKAAKEFFSKADKEFVDLKAAWSGADPILVIREI